jgi:hypothetical protein
MAERVGGLESRLKDPLQIAFLLFGLVNLGSGEVDRRKIFQHKRGLYMSKEFPPCHYCGGQVEQKTAQGGRISNQVCVNQNDHPESVGHCLFCGKSLIGQGSSGPAGSDWVEYCENASCPNK